MAPSSTFIFPAWRGEKPAASSVPLPTIIRGHETLLLVEDEQAVRELIGRMLRGLGYTVYEAQDGIEALALLESRPGLQIDLVVSDIVMPNMNGRELVERVGRLRPGMPSLLLSGHTNDELVHRGVFSAHTSFLQKPFRPHQLAQSVRTSLAKRCAPVSADGAFSI